MEAERSRIGRWGGWALLLFPLAASAQTIELAMPIACEMGVSCLIQNYVDHDQSAGARDYQCGTLTYDRHDGTDFRLATMAAQRAGVGVLAAASGEVLRTRDGVADSLIPSTEQPAATDRGCGNGVVISHPGEWETQYCHLARGSVRLKPGDRVSTGQVIASVGVSGLTQFPHLHLSVRHRGKTVDPFAFGVEDRSCGGGTSLWSKNARTTLAYRQRAVLNEGFAAEPVNMEQVESGEATRMAPTTDALTLVAFVRAIGLRANDEQTLSISAPDGQVMAARTEKPLERSKAQYLLFVGRKRPGAGWAAGLYRASYVVTNEGRAVLERHYTLSLQ